MFVRELESFIAVAETLNFSVASQQLYMSQPGLSKSISNLENELGFRLFDRSTRRVRLTESGERFYRLTKAFLEQCKTLSDSSAPETLIGSLSIAFGSIVDSIYLPSIISMFSDQYPGISIQTSILDAETGISSVGNGKVDICLISNFAIHLKKEPNLCSEFFYPCKLQIAVWRGHPLANRKTVRLEELADEKFLFIQPTINRGADVLNSLCIAAGFIPTVQEYLNDFRLMFLHVAQKRGVAFNLTMPEVATFPDIVLIDVDIDTVKHLVPAPGVVLAWKKDTRNSSVAPFLKLVREMRPPLPTE